MRLIDADALYRKVKTKTNPYGKPTLDYASGVKVLDMIQQEPPIDAVEVVRCRNCMFWKSAVEDGVFSITYGECRCPLGEWREMETTSNDYCSNGRRESNVL